ncbi:hypothetical protein K440DRAFT_659292 [Wilcoxina mikolae CBS 423.85]|nr:hypothetical protein K440DRAFT_659292 [Wilcoxina mikolae CBS 423.85]
MPSNRRSGEPSTPKSPGAKHYRGHRVDKHQHGKHAKKTPTLNNNKKGSRRKAESQHALSEEFTESLHKSTSSIATKLASSLRDIHQIRISRLAAATAQSQTFLNTAREKAAKLEATHVLSTDLDEKMQDFNLFAAEKNANIDKIWEEWKSITKEIIELQKEAKSIHAFGSLYEKDPLDADQNDDEEEGEDSKGFMQEIFEKVRGVGRKWVGRMEESERKLADEAQKQRQLAAAAML